MASDVISFISLPWKIIWHSVHSFLSNPCCRYPMTGTVTFLGMSFQGFSAFATKCLYLIPTLNPPSALGNFLPKSQETTHTQNCYVLSQYSFLIRLSSAIFHCRSPRTFLVTISALPSVASIQATVFWKWIMPNRIQWPWSCCEELKNNSIRVLGYTSAYMVQNTFSFLQVKDHSEFQFFCLKKSVQECRQHIEI